jgi:hypothetical protein
MWRERLSRGTVTCDEITQQLTDEVLDLTELDRRWRRHAVHCLRCQAHAAQHRKMSRALHDLRSVVVDPPAGFVSDVVALLDEEPVPGTSRGLLSGRRVAYAGGLAVATAAGAVSAAVLTARSRRTHASV